MCRLGNGVLAGDMLAFALFERAVVKKLAAVISVAAWCATPALAADMPVKAPPVPPAAYGWTGCYIGANAGYAWQSGRSGYRDDPNTTADPINGSPNTVFITTLATIPEPANTNGRGWIGGGEAGCNWQIDRGIVVGVESDVGATGVSGSATTVGPNFPGLAFGVYQVAPGAVVTGGGIANENVSLRWLSTVRARAGLPVLAGRALLFVTGGLAVGGVSSSGMVDLNTVTGVLAWGGSNSSIRTGYATGGGVEYALTDHWTTKAEYLYYNLGNVSHPLNLLANTTTTALVYTTLGNTVSSARGSIIRVGLNYRVN
jgi:outer membrane immunogenic protein